MGSLGRGRGEVKKKKEKRGTEGRRKKLILSILLLLQLIFFYLQFLFLLLFLFHQPFYYCSFSCPILAKEFLWDHGYAHHVKLSHNSRSRINSHRYPKLYIKGKAMAHQSRSSQDWCSFIQHWLQARHRNGFMCVGW